MANPIKAGKAVVKGVTAGMRKAPAKVQKGLNKTSNRIPGKKPTIARVNTFSFNKPKVTTVETGPIRSRTFEERVIKGSNKDAAKGNVPKRTPGVKKNKSLQRSINKSNNELKR
jgi:hypothetical protein